MQQMGMFDSWSRHRVVSILYEGPVLRRTFLSISRATEAYHIVCLTTWSKIDACQRVESNALTTGSPAVSLMSLIEKHVRLVLFHTYNIKVTEKLHVSSTKSRSIKLISIDFVQYICVRGVVFD